MPLGCLHAADAALGSCLLGFEELAKLQFSVASGSWPQASACIIPSSCGLRRAKGRRPGWAGGSGAVDSRPSTLRPRDRAGMLTGATGEGWGPQTSTGKVQPRKDFHPENKLSQDPGERGGGAGREQRSTHPLWGAGEALRRGDSHPGSGVEGVGCRDLNPALPGGSYTPCALGRTAPSWTRPSSMSPRGVSPRVGGAPPPAADGRPRRGLDVGFPL